MKCPRDGTALQKVDICGVELDKCHQCDGIWFDHGELEQLVTTDIVGLEDKLEAKYGDPPVETGEVDGYMRCPRCDDGRLTQYQYTYLKPVKIDRCQNCLGVWLDDTELDAIVGESETLEKVEEQFRIGAFVKSVMKSWSRK